MPTLREVRNRIGGVRKTQKITRAMKMVAAAKLRRAQGRVIAARPYAEHMREVLGHLTTQPTEMPTAFLEKREVRNAVLVVVTSDRGFCGAFNANLLKSAEAHVAGFGERVGAKVYCIGRKGNDFFARRGYIPAGKRIGIFGNLVFQEAQSIATDLIDGFLRGKFDLVEVVYNEFKSVAQPRVAIEQFLPFSSDESAAARLNAPEYIYEPSRRENLLALIPLYLHFMIWRVLLESNCAEEAARMTAMENATDNAQEMLTTLQLQYNKARQAAITKELMEVVAGAEALRIAE
jgi:F-type H+-transporting ATPase subunit gamma